MIHLCDLSIHSKQSETIPVLKQQTIDVIRLIARYLAILLLCVQLLYFRVDYRLNHPLPLQDFRRSKSESPPPSTPCDLVVCLVYMV